MSELFAAAKRSRSDAPDARRNGHALGLTTSEPVVANLADATVREFHDARREADRTRMPDALPVPTQFLTAGDYS